MLLCWLRRWGVRRVCSFIAGHCGIGFLSVGPGFTIAEGDHKAWLLVFLRRSIGGTIVVVIVQVDLVSFILFVVSTVPGCCVLIIF